MKTYFRFLLSVGIGSIAILSMASCTNSNSANKISGVYDGDLSDLESVVALSDNFISEDESPRNASGVVIKDRCILTAAHNVDGYSQIDIFPAQRPYAPNPVKYVRSERAPLLHPHYNAVKGTNDQPYFDLALVWMERQGCKLTGAVGSHYHCDFFNPAETRNWEPTWSALEPVTAVDDAPNTKGDDVTIVGYGITSEPGEATADIKRREGAMEVFDTHVGPATPAPLYQLGTKTKLAPINGDLHFSCGGDSGGAAIFEDGLFGIITGSTGYGCGSTENSTWATTFHNFNAEFVKHDQAKKYCRVKMAANGWSSPSGFGEIQMVHNDPLGEYSYSSETCDICQKSDAIDITFTAAPFQGYVFEEWTSDPQMDWLYDTCPCAGSTSTTCVVDNDAISFAQEKYGVYCFAKFWYDM